jgi:dihydropteroate synthase
MGVMNITPDSFSDGGLVKDALSFTERLQLMGHLDALDIGAESTAPMNSAISWQEEWERLAIIAPILPQLQCLISLDTYHPETIFKFAQVWKGPLIWNDVSGKFDDTVRDFLKDPKHQYVLCHNRAPTRELTTRHMDYVRPSDSDILQELATFFTPHLHPRVILDPCLGFAKSYEENWQILERFHELQNFIPHQRWVLGLSRKSFLRRKFNLGLEQREALDQVQLQVLQEMLPHLSGELWIRTHRPELLII